MMNMECYTCDRDLDEDEMMAEFDISYTDYEIFMDWTMHFVYEYVGCGSLIPFEQKKVPVSVTELVNREREKHQMHKQDVL